VQVGTAQLTINDMGVIELIIKSLTAATRIGAAIVGQYCGTDLKLALIFYPAASIVSRLSNVIYKPLGIIRRCVG
jgi:hypothetical protein